MRYRCHEPWLWRFWHGENSHPSRRRAMKHGVLYPMSRESVCLPYRMSVVQTWDFYMIAKQLPRVKSILDHNVNKVAAHSCLGTIQTWAFEAKNSGKQSDFTSMSTCVTRKYESRWNSIIKYWACNFQTTHTHKWILDVKQQTGGHEPNILDFCQQHSEITDLVPLKMGTWTKMMGVALWKIDRQIDRQTNFTHQGKGREGNQRFCWASGLRVSNFYFKAYERIKWIHPCSIMYCTYCTYTDVCLLTCWCLHVWI